MATLKDVANLAGVSIATVSNYLNNTKPVSKVISKKIQDAVNELHYSINLNAKNLKSKINTDIGVILPSLNDSYYVQLFQGIKSYFQNTNYYLNLDFSENIPEFEKNIVHNVDQHIIIWHFRRIKLCRNNAGIFHPRTPGILVITVIEKIITVITRLKMGYFNFPDSANYGIK